MIGRHHPIHAAHRRDHIHEARTFGERAADAVAAAMGSWTFIITQSVVVGSWIAFNLLALIRHWDPYPFILLNLLFSTQAAYAAPIIMMSQNRAAAKDRLRDDHEAAEVTEIRTIDAHTEQAVTALHDLTGKVHDIIIEVRGINATQDETLLLIKRALAEEKPPSLDAASDHD